MNGNYSPAVVRQVFEICVNDAVCQPDSLRLGPTAGRMGKQFSWHWQGSQRRVYAYGSREAYAVLAAAHDAILAQRAIHKSDCGHAHYGGGLHCAEMSCSNYYMKHWHREADERSRDISANTSSA